MAISKVTLNGDTLMDVTQDTVTANNLLSGETATGADGVGVTGNIATKTSSDMTVSGATVTAPAGYYATAASKSVASGSLSQPDLTFNSSNNLIRLSYGVSTSGYIEQQSKTKEYNTAGILPTQAAKTVTPTTSSQTAVAANKWTTGEVTVAAIPSEYVIPTGTKTITENGTGIDVASYASVDVDVAGQAASGVKYIWTDEDGEGAWDVSGYQYCAVDGAAVPDRTMRLWIEVGNNEQFSMSLANIVAYSNPDVDRIKAVIYWGDGEYTQMNDATYTTTYVSYTHTYLQKGKRIIEIVQSDPTYANIRANKYCFGQSADTPNTSVKYMQRSTNFSCDSSGYSFRYCNGLKKIRLLRFADYSSGSRTCQYSYANCQALETIEFIDIPVEGHSFIYHINTLDTYSFAYCPNLKNIVYTNASDYSLTQLYSGAFRECTSIKDTSFLLNTGTTRIADAVFRNCTGMEYIYIPITMTRIGMEVFYGCTGVKEIHFYSATPPTVDGSSAFKNIPTTCKIYVPTGTLSAYTSAANYPDPATYTYIEE